MFLPCVSATLQSFSSYSSSTSHLIQYQHLSDCYLAYNESQLDLCIFVKTCVMVSEQNKRVRQRPDLMRVVPLHFERSDSEKSGPEQAQLSFPSPAPCSPSNRSPLDSEREPETSFTSATDIPSARLRKKTAKANSVDSKKMPRSHRDSNGGGPYERLETGFGGPSDGAGAKRGGRFTWKKMAVVAVVFIGLVWVFGPRVKQHYGYGSASSDDYDVDPPQGSPIAGTRTTTTTTTTQPTPLPTLTTSNSYP